MASIQRYNNAVTATKAVGRKTGVGEIERRNHPKKWIILATTSNKVEDLTGMIAVASILRYHDAVTSAKAVKGTTGVGETERR